MCLKIGLLSVEDLYLDSDCTILHLIHDNDVTLLSQDDLKTFLQVSWQSVFCTLCILV